MEANRRSDRPYVLAIGGFDPSGGAGVVADCKTIDAHGALGLSVITANTLQHEDRYVGTHWVDPGTIYAQIGLLLERYPLSAVKVGMVPSGSVLRRVLDLAFQANPRVPVVVDPVLRSTASSVSLRTEGGESPSCPWERGYAGITLLTPNRDEYLSMYGDEDPRAVSSRLGCALLLKGGHGPVADGKVIDCLYMGGAEYQFAVDRVECDKHGTGCVLSSAIASALAWGAGLVEACRDGQRYVHAFLQSGSTRLGIHRGEGEV